VNTNSDLCEWLHRSLYALRLFSYPFDLKALPANGIYFFYEKGECCSHEGERPRIVRVGTHRDGNFQSRIAEHFLFDERKMVFTEDQPAPHERSIFRKHIGRALLNEAEDPYLSVWEMDFTTRELRERNRHLRDIRKEVAIEREVTRMLRENFSFRFIEVADQVHRMGSEGLERGLIGTLASCPHCEPSAEWLGNYSPKPKICQSGLWLIQHLRAAPLSPAQQSLIAGAIEKTIASGCAPLQGGAGGQHGQNLNTIKIPSR
jgi:hypothetical protein